MAKQQGPVFCRSVAETWAKVDNRRMFSGTGRKPRHGFIIIDSVIEPRHSKQRLWWTHSMRLEGRRQSKNVEDLRRSRKTPVAIGGGLGMVVLVIIAMLFNVDVQPLLNQVQQAQPGQVQPGQADGERELTAEEEAQGVFASQVLALTEDVWGKLLQQYGVRYQEPGLKLFSGSVDSQCGAAGSEMGPFYCPADSKIYIDLSFFEDLSNRFGAPGDFARAYVIAHEVGHHIQNLMGTTDKIDAMRGRVSEVEMNDLSVRLELQADFYAGVFAHHLQGIDRILERGDIEEAIRCAGQIGDDRLQKAAGRRVSKESFTHGSSEQRQRWFQKGFDTGDLSQGDTFAATRL
jgi:uncharacterized protein